MRAEQIMTRDPRTVTPNQTVAEAVKVMTTEDCGVVPVVQSDRELQVIGVVTDRDIALRACAENGPGPSASVSSVMTSNVFCVSPNDDLARVREVMESAGVRRVPVVDDNRHLLGIISLKDVAENAGDNEVGGLDSRILEQKPNN
jgi:CBS domain-containing protein